MNDTFINANGIQLHIRDWGGPGGKTPLVLVHGLASNARIWDLVAPRLASERRIVALDLRGHGLSEKPGSGYDFATIVADLTAVISALGFQKPLVVGHSWGANVALQLAAGAPGLLAGVVLVDGGTAEYASMMSLDQALVRLAPPRLAGTPRAAFVDLLRARWEPLGWSPEIEAIILSNFSIDTEDRITPHLSYENHMQVVHAIYNQRPTELFARAGCPVLIIPAAPPILTDEAAQLMKLKRQSVRAAEASIPHVQVVWAHDSVHDIPLHQPAFLASQILDFARSVTK